MCIAELSMKMFYYLKGLITFHFSAWIKRVQVAFQGNNMGQLIVGYLSQVIYIKPWQPCF